MAASESNSGDVIRSVGILADALNLRGRPLGDKRLGDEVIDAAVGAIVARTVGRQERPDGAPLRPLRPRTVARKKRLGLDPRILVETHTMMDPEQVRGRTAVGRDYAVTLAGLDEETERKVMYAHESDRPFEDLGADGQAAVDGVIALAVEAAVERASG